MPTFGLKSEVREGNTPEPLVTLVHVRGLLRGHIPKLPLQVAVDLLALKGCETLLNLPIKLLKVAILGTSTILLLPQCSEEQSLPHWLRCECGRK